MKFNKEDNFSTMVIILLLETVIDSIFSRIDFLEISLEKFKIPSSFALFNISINFFFEESVNLSSLYTN